MRSSLNAAALTTRNRHRSSVLIVAHLGCPSSRPSSPNALCSEEAETKDTNCDRARGEGIAGCIRPSSPRITCRVPLPAGLLDDDAGVSR